MKTLFSDLPVYSAAQILLLTVFQRTKSLSREYKYTLAEDMKKKSFEILLEIYRANRNAATKLSHINIARDHIEFLRLAFRILKEMKQISLSHFIDVSSEINDVSKQLNGWAKSCGNF